LLAGELVERLGEGLEQVLGVLLGVVKASKLLEQQLAFVLVEELELLMEMELVHMLVRLLVLVMEMESDQWLEQAMEVAMVDELDVE